MNTIRFAAPDDAAALLRIYAQYIETPITFEYTLPSEEEFARRIRDIQAVYPYLVYIEDGEVLGYAYAHRFQERAAYQWGAELSVYLDRGCVSHGIGSQLYTLLLELLRLQNVRTAYALVTLPNTKSEALHRHFGFKLCGVWHLSGHARRIYCPRTAGYKSFMEVCTMVLERFLRYVRFYTTSDESSDTVPSTARQRVLGQALADELDALGMKGAQLDEYGYVYAHLPASPGCEDARPLGLIAHMDTAPAASGENVQPRVVRYEGGELALGASVLSPRDYPSLERYVGQELIVTDGATLLGADDKAGVAEIVSACAELLAHPEIPHRAIAVCFTPDEEIGRGADHFDRAKFPAPVAYTVDGGELGEIEYENFNAAAAELTVRGLNIHPGEAKNKMKNAVLMANQFLSLLPPAQTPAHTEGYEGFYHVCAMEGDESLARVQLIVRDHDRKKFETRKDFLRRTADYLNTVWGAGSFELTVRDSYYNMKEKILPHMDLIENAQAAMRAADVAPRIVAIRGGTDGARLSWEGLPCPNLSTGGLNFHSIHEYIPVESLQKMTRVLVALARA